MILAFALSAGAQNMYDAINFSRNDYFGTARSMSLGNAVTAVGGDLGTVGINPAGSAVSNYGQMVITVSPGLSVSSVGSEYSPVGESQYGNFRRTERHKFSLPNLGLSLVFDTGRSSGLKSVTFSLVSNQTAQYNYKAAAEGYNDRTSMVAELAAASYGYAEDVLGKYASYSTSSVPWDVLTAYQAGLVDRYGSDPAQYAGISETLVYDEGLGRFVHYLPGTLAQSSLVSKTGQKKDVVFNFGMNFSDVLLLGVNIGMPSAEYRYSESFSEIALDNSLFPLYDLSRNGTVYNTEFAGASKVYDYSADYEGVYAKFGVILTPFAGLRLGAAFQTPIIYEVSEQWRYTMSSYFTNPGADIRDVSSPLGEYSYCLRSPYIFNVGAAYTFGRLGLVSVDYELADYSVMKFSEAGTADYYPQDSFYDLNETNRRFAGVSHALRIGAELRVTPAFSLRAGFSTLSSPERHWTNDLGEDVTADDFLADFHDYNHGSRSLVNSSYYEDRTNSVSAGFGYSSAGSFFCDFAVRLAMYPTTTYAPYYDYDNYDIGGTLVNVASPRIMNKINLWSAAMTFGWRF